MLSRDRSENVVETMTASPSTVVFIIPPHLKKRGRLIPSHHPIITATLAGVAKATNARVFVMDMGVTDLDRSTVLEHLKEIAPDWVGLVPFEYRREMPLEPSLKMIEFCRPHFSKVRFGVLNCPLHSEESRDAVRSGQLDFAVFGDSESFVHRVCTTGKWDGAGLCIQQGQELLEFSPVQQVDWNIVTPPAWELFNLHRYVPSAHRYRRAPVLPIFASRSCPFGCDFCPHMLYHSSDTHSMRPVADIISEIELLQRDFGVETVEFYDPTFGVRRDHVHALCESFKKLERPIEWTCFSRADLWDESLLQQVYDAGCRSILFGVESGNVEVLERTQKGIHLPQVEQFVSQCRQVGIDTVASFIIGLPLETPTRIVETIDFAKKLNPTYAQFHQARAFFEHSDWQELGTVSGSWEETSASLNGLAYIPNGFTQREIVQWLLRAYWSFYSRPAKVAELTGSVRQWSDVRRLLKGVHQISTHFVVL